MDALAESARAAIALLSMMATRRWTPLAHQQHAFDEERAIEDVPHVTLRAS